MTSEEQPKCDGSRRIREFCHCHVPAQELPFAWCPGCENCTPKPEAGKCEYYPDCEEANGFGPCPSKVHESKPPQPTDEDRPTQDFENLIGEAVRDITRVGVCPAPKSAVRKILERILASHSAAVRKETWGKALAAVPEQVCEEEWLDEGKNEAIKWGRANGENAAREHLISAAKSDGVEVKSE